MIISRNCYRSDITFMLLKSISDNEISLPVYMILLSEDLLTSLPTIESRYGEELKLETSHGLRKFRVWFSRINGEGRIRVEEFFFHEWVVIHAYRSL